MKKPILTKNTKRLLVFGILKKVALVLWFLYI